MNREEIKSLLDVEPTYNFFEEFLSVNQFAEPWFKGVIDSLRYRPNKNLLVLPPDSISFIPEEFMIGNDLYTIFILDTEFNKSSIDKINRDDFFMRDLRDGYVEADKRLSSYICTTTNWVLPQRKNVFQIVKPFPLVVDSLDLWREIYKKYKTDPES